MSSGGWGEGGLYLSKLTWLDGLDDEDSSIPIPTAPAAQDPNFITNFGDDWVSIDGQWSFTPSGLDGGNALTDAFYMSSLQAESTTFTVDSLIKLITKDGNPTSSPGNWTRDGSAAALVIWADRENPFDASLCVNVHTDSTPGVKVGSSFLLMSKSCRSLGSLMLKLQIMPTRFNKM